MYTLSMLVTGHENQSHFREKEISLQQHDHFKDLFVASLGHTSELFIWSAPQGKEFQWVNAPQEQYFFYMAGLVEIEVGCGEKRQFKAGDILLVTDTTGQGHITRILEPMLAAVMTCPEIFIPN